jgi:hypothetical protein
MTPTRRNGYLEIYIQYLCPPDVVMELMQKIKMQSGVVVEDEHQEFDFYEAEILYQSELIILQYDMSIGISVYHPEMSDATPAQEKILEQFAKCISEL